MTEEEHYAKLINLVYPLKAITKDIFTITCESSKELTRENNLILQAYYFSSMELLNLLEERIEEYYSDTQRKENLLSAESHN